MHWTYEIHLNNVVTGVSKTVEFGVNWRPDRVNAEEVGKACAAMYTVQEGIHRREPESRYIALSSKLTDPTPELEKELKS